MSKAKIQLSFNCPERWDGMIPTACGKHCSKCDLVVHDFSKVESGELAYEMGRVEASCGHFRAEDVEKPFGNWKDHVIEFYQNVEARLGNQKILKPVALFFLMGILFVAGCRAFCVSGRMRPLPPLNDSSSQNTSIDIENEEPAG